MTENQLKQKTLSWLAELRNTFILLLIARQLTLEAAQEVDNA